jgi:integrase
MNELQTVYSQVQTKELPAGYKADMNVFNKWLDDRQVNRETIKEYFDNMKSLGRKAATISRHRAAIKASLISMRGSRITDAERAELREFFSQIRPGKPSVEKLREDMLEPKEIKSMFKHCGSKTTLLIRALYQSATRISELINIRIDDCETLTEGVRARITHGKGNKERFVYLRKETYDAIREAWQGTTYLFEHKGKAINRTSVYLMTRRAGQYIGKKISPHVMRHSWASNHIEDMPLAAVSGYLGHADTSTTAKFYLHNKPTMGQVLLEDGI